jgi:hypothetical protein
MDRIELNQDKSQVAGSCECGNEHSSSVKSGLFLDYIKTDLLYKKASKDVSSFPNFLTARKQTT